MFEVLEIDFCDVITSVLCSAACEKTRIIVKPFS